MQRNKDLVDLTGERVVLATVLQTPRHISDLVAAGMVEENFSSPHHRALWRLLLARQEAGEPIGMLEIIQHLHQTGTAAEVGGYQQIEILADCQSSVYDPEYWGRIVRELAQMRRIRDAGRRLVDLPDQYGAIGAGGVLDAAEQELLGLAASAPTSSTDGKGAAMAAQSRRAERRRALERGESLGVLTGIDPVDEMVRCLRRRELSVLAARPGMGKTSLCLEIARQALRRGEGVGILSLEMPTEQLVDKLLCLEAGIPTSSLEMDRLSPPQEDAWAAAGDALYRWPVLIDDRGDMTLPTARSLGRAWKMRQKNLRLLIVDYLQLLRGPGDTGEERIAATSQGLKALAKELDVAVLAVAQLNRECEERRDKRPQLSDLRGSGQIEQDAGLIAFLYRHHRYDPEADPTDAEFIVAKNRFGQEGRCRLHFDGSTQRFSDPSGSVYYSQGWGGGR